MFFRKFSKSIPVRNFVIIIYTSQLFRCKISRLLLPHLPFIQSCFSYLKSFCHNFSAFALRPELPLLFSLNHNYMLLAFNTPHILNPYLTLFGLLGEGVYHGFSVKAATGSHFGPYTILLP